MLKYIRVPGVSGVVDEGETVELIEYVGSVPSRQVRVVLSDDGHDENGSVETMYNSAYDWTLLTDSQLDDKWPESEREYIDKEVFEVFWIKSFEYLARNSRKRYNIDTLS